LTHEFPGRAENISIEPRKLVVAAVSDWCTLAPLICEDLARQEPVASVIRSIGPTFVLALLLDGPQLKERWSARYAASLADDPGTSVLCLSSLGMVERCLPPGKPASRVIGFWRDSGGSLSELSLAPGAVGILLTLRAEWIREYAADGRHDGGCATRLYLTKITQVSL
jgi:hypothetical protein